MGRLSAIKIQLELEFVSHQRNYIFSYGHIAIQYPITTNVSTSNLTYLLRQEGQRCPKRRVAQAAIRLATAVI